MTSQKNGWFKVTWWIENFSTCLFEDQIRLGTSLFKTDMSDGDVWWKLHVENENPTASLAFILEKISGNSKNDACEMSASSCFGEVTLVQKQNSVGKNFYFTVPKSEIYSEKENCASYQVPKDSITIHCKVSHDMLTPGQRSFRTILSKNSVQWNLNQFNCVNLKSILMCVHNKIPMTTTILRSKHSQEVRDGNRKLVFEVLPNEDGWPSFVSFKLRELYNRGTLYNENPSFPCTTQVWSLLIHNWQFTRVYPSLTIEYALGIEMQLHHNSKITPEMSGTKVPSNKATPSLIPIVNKEILATTVLSTYSNSLVNDLQLMYKDGTFSDATLKTEEDSFPAHRTILAARSPVFRAMFEGDHTTEGRSGVVEIDDLDSATVDRMLAFLYGDSLAQLGFEDALLLYYAADKYAVQPLKQRCVDVLETGLSVSNVCDALALADTHADEQLMKRAVEFVRCNQEVMATEKWDRLEEENLRLTAGIMKQILVKKRYC